MVNVGVIGLGYVGTAVLKGFETITKVLTLDEFKAQINDILYEYTDIEEITWSMTPNGI